MSSHDPLERRDQELSENVYEVDVGDAVSYLHEHTSYDSHSPEADRALLVERPESLDNQGVEFRFLENGHTGPAQIVEVSNPDQAYEEMIE